MRTKSRMSKKKGATSPDRVLRKLHRVAKSAVVTLPPQFLDACGLSIGDMVWITFEKNEIKIKKAIIR